MLNRSGLNAIRGSIGMGQGNIRNENTRSNDMFNSPYAKGGMQTNGPVKPEYASGGGLNQNPGGMQQGDGWNPYGFNGFMGAGSNAPYNGPVGGGFAQQKPEAALRGPDFTYVGTVNAGAPNPGQPGDAGTQAPQVNAPNRWYSPPRLPKGPVIPRFMYQGNPSGTQRADWWAANRPRPFGNRPVVPNPQQPGPYDYKPGDGSIELPPQPQEY